ncbi:hypothetical protein B0H10DRAFT_2223299 [Mycena sp. CBHHK59/15]|nr:hypothetical protein B0H10DRAFT_2223299 [Mycena sp. CBHHK59/15]
MSTATCSPDNLPVAEKIEEYIDAIACCEAACKPESRRHAGMRASSNSQPPTVLKSSDANPAPALTDAVRILSAVRGCVVDPRARSNTSTYDELRRATRLSLTSPSLPSRTPRGYCRGARVGRCHDPAKRTDGAAPTPLHARPQAGEGVSASVTRIEHAPRLRSVSRSMQHVPKPPRPPPSPGRSALRIRVG